MSFLDSVLTSIETGKPSAIPPTTSRRPEPPVSSSTAKSEVRKPSTPSRDASSEKKVATAGTKRKAEEQLQRPSKSDNRAPGKSVPTRPAPTRPAPTRPASTKPAPSRPTTSTASKSRSNPAPNAANSASSSNTSAASKTVPASSKPPPGSFADLMMKAKALQQTAPAQVGMFKHQNKTAPKERLSKMERKKRAMEAQAKEKDPRLAKKGSATAGTPAGAKLGDGRLARKRDPGEPTYKGTARPTQMPATTEYRGTAGLPPKRDPAERQQSKAGKRSRMDDYLGTDEEDEGEYADDYEDYYSDASSDMEAGFDNVESEEQAALKAARREDEEEWQAELAAKQEKLERKKKLTSLASRAR